MALPLHSCHCSLLLHGCNDEGIQYLCFHWHMRQLRVETKSKASPGAALQTNKRLILLALLPAVYCDATCDHGRLKGSILSSVCFQGWCFGLYIT